MDKEDIKGRIFAVAKQISSQNKAVVGEGCVKDYEGNVVVDQDEIKEVWRKYFDKLSNEEFVWDSNTLGTRDVVCGPAEAILADEVRAAIAKMKNGKAAGPSVVGVEMLKAAGEEGVLWVTDLCNAIVREGRIPDDCKRAGWCVCTKAREMLSSVVHIEA